MSLKNLVCVLILAGFSTTAFASDPGITCESTMKFPNDDDTIASQEIFIEVEPFSNGESLVANVTQDSVSREEKVEFLEQTVREGLRAIDLEDDEDDLEKNLNDTEKAIALAMTFQAEEGFKEVFDSGIEDLSKVRSASTYVIGERTVFGAMMLIEAKDANGEVLGKFIGGTIVLSPCK